MKSIYNSLNTHNTGSNWDFYIFPTYTGLRYRHLKHVELQKLRFSKEPLSYLYHFNTIKEVVLPPH